MLERLPDGIKVLCEPGRSLVANPGVSLYTVGTVKDVPGVRRYVAVDGGMADNIRPMLYGAHYEAEIADRVGDSTPCRLVGMHCESGDILIEDARLEDPRVGDIVVIPATGAYGHSMASNYNAVPRPPVIFCSEGDARVVVRRETYEDLTSRDVRALRNPRAHRRRTGRASRPAHAEFPNELSLFASGCWVGARSAGPSPTCSPRGPTRSRLRPGGGSSWSGR